MNLKREEKEKREDEGRGDCCFCTACHATTACCTVWAGTMLHTACPRNSAFADGHTQIYASCPTCLDLPTHPGRRSLQEDSNMHICHLSLGRRACPEAILKRQACLLCLILGLTHSYLQASLTGGKEGTFSPSICLAATATFFRQSMGKAPALPQTGIILLGDREHGGAPFGGRVSLLQ